MQKNMPTHLPLPPGPRGIPVWGNLWAFRHRRLNWLASLPSFGDVSFARFGRKPIYTVHHPDLIKQVLVDDADNYHKLRLTRNMFQQALSRDDVLRKTEAWIKRREVVQTAFHARHVESYAEAIIAEVQAQLASWQPGRVLDVYQAMRELTLNVVVKTVFATPEFDRDLAFKILTATRILQTHGSKRFDVLWEIPLWFPTPNNRPVKKAIATLHSFINKLIDEVKTGLDRQSSSQRDDVLALLVLEAMRPDGVISISQIREELMSLLISGHETTSTALAWTLYLLSSHPQSLAEVRTQVREVLGQRLITLADLPHMPLVEASIQEAMRLYPPAWTISRQVLAETTLGGYLVPPNVTVFINPYSLHRDLRWFRQPEAFLPERFLIDDIPRYAYIPFSMGPRKCIGSSFAMQEAQLVLVSILQKFDLVHVPNQKILPVAQISLRPRYGLKVGLAHPGSVQ
jgi:cytochrome P450